MTRILLRYAASALIAKGALAPEIGNAIAADPDVFQLLQIALGLLAAAVSEWWYYLAVKFGWAK
ncbi:hypothetical protein [Gellertiella hungarica]|uniref:hypothetical protein n=1 Tax=Gellertiella hungarica TaxID=1572859 RepID=UPI0031B563F4